MKGTLTNKSSFKDLENWFAKNLDELPETLESDCRYYADLKSTIKQHIRQVYIEADRLGIEEVKKKRSALANASKGNLYTIYVDLQKRENWNAPRPKLNLINQRT